MADFRSFTIAASVTAIVLGASIGAALGAPSGPQPPLIVSQKMPMGAPSGPATHGQIAVLVERHPHELVDRRRAPAADTGTNRWRC